MENLQWPLIYMMGVLKNFAKLPEKHLWQSLLIKVAGFSSLSRFKKLFVLCVFLGISRLFTEADVYCVTSVLKIFAKLKGKHLCQSLWNKYFPVNLAKFLSTPFFIKYLLRLLTP